MGCLHEAYIQIGVKSLWDKIIPNRIQYICVYEVCTHVPKIYMKGLPADRLVGVLVYMSGQQTWALGLCPGSSIYECRGVLNMVRDC